MTSDTLRERLEIAPFQRFWMRLPDGRALEVPHPDFVSISPDGRTAIVWRGDGGRYSTVDLEIVSDLEPA